MEYLEGGELLSLVEEKGHFTEMEARNFFQQLVSAIAYCHTRKVIHRDLKLENLLLTNSDKAEIKVKPTLYGRLLTLELLVWLVN